MMLQARENAAGGMEVYRYGLPADTTRFRHALIDSIAQWRQAGKSHVWLTVPRTRAELIPEATAVGFTFFHAQADELTLVLRLTPEAVLPPGPTHTLAVGAAVISAQGDLLVVRGERDGETRPYTLSLPEGPVEPGEHVIAAVQRTVLEQTGIDTYFSAMVGLQHDHGRELGASALCFVALLRPLTHAITPADGDTRDTGWMPVDEFLEHPDVHPLHRRFVRLAKAEIGWSQTHVAGYSANPHRTELIMGSVAWERRHRVSLLFVRDGKMLLFKRQRNGRTYYITPGGGVDPGETFAEAAVREGDEETGLDFVLGPEISVGRRGDQIEHVYLVTEFSGTPRLGGPELERSSPTNIYEFVWVRLDQVNELVRYPGPVNVTAVVEALNQ